MAHFARIDDNNKVVDVLVVSNEQEHRGQEFLAADCGLGGTWIQTSYNGNIRGKFAGIDYTYDVANDRFIEPAPFPSWTLDADFTWKAPVAKPNTGKLYDWDESTLSWVEVVP
jgi:hypothetical protein